MADIAWVSATGGGAPIIEKILGVNAAGTATNNYPPDQNVGTSQTATWATGPASSALATKGYLKLSSWDGTSNYKLLVWNSSDVLIGTSDALSISSYDAYIEFTFSTPVSITKSATYKLGYVNQTGFQVPYVVAGGNGVHYGNNNYTTPTNWDENTTGEAAVTIACYLTGDTQ